jgi:hypothetical protein
MSHQVPQVKSLKRMKELDPNVSSLSFSGKISEQNEGISSQ